LKRYISARGNTIEIPSCPFLFFLFLFLFPFPFFFFFFFFFFPFLSFFLFFFFFAIKLVPARGRGFARDPRAGNFKCRGTEIKPDDLFACDLGWAPTDYPQFRAKSRYEIYSIDLFSYQILVLVKWRFTKTTWK